VAECQAGARAMCVWLGTLASWRPGLIGHLLREYRTTADVLQRPPGEIVAFAARRSGWGGSEAAEQVYARAPKAERVSDAERFAAALREGPAACLRRAERRPPGDAVVAWSEALYPDQLRDLADPPLCLFVRGGADAKSTGARLSALVETPLVAVVGTRSPSPYGEDMARMLAGGLARAGVVVVSGLALGIDAVAQKAAVEAHAAIKEAALDADAGTPLSTVAVLGCGADVVYPRRHAGLYARVAGGGLVLSEFAWGVPARTWRFPARNRVMAALGRAVVLVEGAKQSGGRITAGHATDLGRDVLCVPGEAGRKLSEAPNRLLDDGARVCESAADVLRVIGVGDPGPGASSGAASSELPALVLDHGGGAVRDVLRALQMASFTIDELSVRCGLPASKVAAAVSDLEVEGFARRVDGGRYRLLRSWRAV
jgi:DNA processing protein